MKKYVYPIFSIFFLQNLFAEGSSFSALFDLKGVAQIAAHVEVKEVRGGEDLISCKNFRMRLKEASEKDLETTGAVAAEEFRYVLDHTKSYLGFYDYHALTKLKLHFKLPEELKKDAPYLLKTLETKTLKVVSSSEIFSSDKISAWTLDEENLSFEIDLNLADLCLGQEVSFSFYKNCASTDLHELDCAMAEKFSFKSGNLEQFHPTKIRLEKTRLSELGLGGDHE